MLTMTFSIFYPFILCFTNTTAEVFASDFCKYGFVALQLHKGCVALSAETSQKGCLVSEKQTPLKAPQRQRFN